MKPTWAHYFFAQEWPARIWMSMFPISFGTIAAILGWLTLEFLRSWTEVLLFAAYVGLVAALGWFVGILVGWFVLGPLYFDRSIKNGEPFQPGDLVHILVGPYRDRIARVYSTFEVGSFAGAHRVRVELGERKKDDWKDVFSSYQILRISTPNRGDQTEAQPDAPTGTGKPGG